MGAQLFSYVAGSSTKTTLTKDSAGASNHANPIILNARGEPGDGAGASQAMWQAEGSTVKLVLAPSGDTDPPVAAISTWDNLSGINDSAASSAQDEWVSGNTPTFVSTTSFTLVGDQTSDFHVGRRLKTTNSGGTLYSTITAVAFTSLTTVTVENDSTALDSGLSAVSYGVISGENTSDPAGNKWGEHTFNNAVHYTKGADIASASALTLGTDGNYFDVTGTTGITSIGTWGIGSVVKLHFDGALLLTHGATDLILPNNGENITTAAGDEAEFVEYQSGDWICTSYSPANGKQLNTVIPSSMNGLIMSNDTDTAHDINVIAGSAASSGDTLQMILASEMTKQIDVTWVAGDDAGGLSSSLTAPANNTWYHVFLIRVGTAIDVIFDTSLVCANGVADHSVTEYRRIGSVLTDGSANILQFIMYEDGGGSTETIWTTPIEDVDVTDQSTTAVARTLSVPTGINPTAAFNVYFTDADSSPTLLYIRNPDTTDQAPSITASPSVTMDSGGDNIILRTNTSAQVETRANDAGGELQIVTLSYKDARR